MRPSFTDREVRDLIDSVPNWRMYLETLIIDHAFLLTDGSSVPLADLHPVLTTVPILRYFQGETCNGDLSNFWGPNIQGVQEMLTDTGFGIDRVTTVGDRGIFECAVVPEPLVSYTLEESSGAAG